MSASGEFARGAAGKFQDGGGPTRRDILFGLEMQAWPPNMETGTDWAERYDAQKAGLPLLPTVDEAVA